ncbi:hypothetical protein B7463_g6763, partial [Scytalidium lignicola]
MPLTPQQRQDCLEKDATYYNKIAIIGNENMSWPNIPDTRDGYAEHGKPYVNFMQQITKLVKVTDDALTLRVELTHGTFEVPSQILATMIVTVEYHIGISESRFRQLQDRDSESELISAWNRVIVAARSAVNGLTSHANADALRRAHSEMTNTHSVELIVVLCMQILIYAYPPRGNDEIRKIEEIRDYLVGELKDAFSVTRQNFLIGAPTTIFIARATPGGSFIVGSTVQRYKESFGDAVHDAYTKARKHGMITRLKRQRNNDTGKWNRRNSNKPRQLETVKSQFPFRSASQEHLRNELEKFTNTLRSAYKGLSFTVMPDLIYRSPCAACRMLYRFNGKDDDTMDLRNFGDGSCAEDDWNCKVHYICDKTGLIAQGLV